MKLSFVIMTAAIAVAAATAGTAAKAQELKIGYVNSDRVLREAGPAKAAQAKLEAEVKKREKELGDMDARLKAAADKLEKDAPTLAESPARSGRPGPRDPAQAP
jgi:outer membrane protein